MAPNEKPVIADESTEILSLSGADFDQICGVLSEAFAEYPVMMYVLGGRGPDYAEGLASLIRFYVRIYVENGWPMLGCFQDSRLTGVATISPPAAAVDPASFERLSTEVRSLIGEAAYNRMEKYEELAESVLPSETHHYLGMLGTVAGSQGTGVGSRLLEVVHTLASSSEGVCLSTEFATNVGYYERRGYRVVAETRVDDLTAWGMVRDTRQ